MHIKMYKKWYVNKIKLTRDDLKLKFELNIFLNNSKKIGKVRLGRTIGKFGKNWKFFFPCDFCIGINGIRHDYFWYKM